LTILFARKRSLSPQQRDNIGTLGVREKKLTMALRIQPMGGTMNTYSFSGQPRRSPIPRRAVVTLAVLALARGSLASCGEIHDAARKGHSAKVRALHKGNPALVSSKDNGRLDALALCGVCGISGETWELEWDCFIGIAQSRVSVTACSRRRVKFRTNNLVFFRTVWRNVEASRKSSAVRRSKAWFAAYVLNASMSSMLGC
jgi:hypothetical protein